MKDDFQTWFAGLRTVPGLLASGIRRPNGKCTSHGSGENFPVEKIEKLLRQFADLHEPLATSQFSPRWTTWAFEYGHLRFVSRPDKWLLMMLVTPETEAARELDPLSENFLAARFK